MKLTNSAILSLVLFTIDTLSRPTESAKSFDIADLADTNLSPEEFFLTLPEPQALAKRQYSGSTCK